MSQADELLESMSEDDIALYTASPETEGHIIIGTDRQIVVPEELKMIAVQYDHNIETVTFDCIRYWDGRDLSKMNLYINLRLPNGTPDQYLIEDLTVDEDDPKIMHFTWTIEGRTTKYNGNLTFLVCAKRVNAEGKEENHWNSFPNSDMYVTEGLECEEAIVESNPAVLTSLLLRMETAEATVAKIPDDINAALEEAKKNGDFDGKSAYEVALDNGFKGSESEWLASLKGDIGEAFTYEDFTEEQLAALKGEKGDQGDAFTYEDFTEEQLAALKGEKGDAFEYSDFTEEQLKDLKGPKGDAGDDGCSIHVRTTDGWNTVLSSSGATTTMNADDVSDSDNIAINHIVLDKCYANNYYCTCFWVVTGISDGVLSLSGAGYYYVYTGPKGDKGDSGFSPNVQVEEHTEGAGGYDVVITYLDDSGVEMPVSFRIYHGNDGEDGTNGEDGYSPTIETSKSNGTTTITLTDLNGTKYAYINDGEKGDKGDTGDDGYDPQITVNQITEGDGGYEVVITYRDTTGATKQKSFEIWNGADGETGPQGETGPRGYNGNDGADGYSPTIATSKSGGTTTITITDLNGTKYAYINDGEKGDKGDKGDTGSQGPKGDTGATGATGATGPEPSDSRLKTLIANYLNETYFTTGY